MNFIRYFSTSFEDFLCFFSIKGETKLICWSTGPFDPILSKNKKIILQIFLSIRILLIYCFLLFEKNKK